MPVSRSEPALVCKKRPHPHRMRPDVLRRVFRSCWNVGCLFPGADAFMAAVGRILLAAVESPVHDSLGVLLRIPQTAVKSFVDEL